MRFFELHKKISEGRMLQNVEDFKISFPRFARKMYQSRILGDLGLLWILQQKKKRSFGSQSQLLTEFRDKTTFSVASLPRILLCSRSNGRKCISHKMIKTRTREDDYAMEWKRSFYLMIIASFFSRFYRTENFIYGLWLKLQ